MRTLALLTVAAVNSLLIAGAGAHCDTLDGPVVTEARAALEAGDVTPVLKWVRAEDDAGIRAAFAQARSVRVASDDARELADRWFLETLVRVHRAGEGAPFEGLQPAGSVDPAVALADQALADRDPEKLIRAISGHLAAGVRERFQAAAAARAKSAESIAAGRDFVAAYVELMHYVERVHQAVSGGGHAHGDPPTSR